jgi:hypothetical protein
MRACTAILASIAIVIVSAHEAHAATIQVGPAQTYTTACAAIAAAQPNDEIDIAAGTYSDTCEIKTAGLHLKGVGGRPKFDLTGKAPAQSKGIFVVTADDITIENLELMGAAISDVDGGNGAGLRIQGNGDVVTHCYIHDNQDGILATANAAGGSVTIEYTELANNGLGDACDATSCVHNVYVGMGGAGAYAKLIFQFNWTHALATDTADKGHLLKSRALESDVLYNRITGEAGHDSYEIDLPNGGLGIVVGNVIEKGPNPDNKILLAYGEEGYGAGTNTLYVVNNTFVNDDAAGGATSIDVAAGGMLSAAHNNLFVGQGTLSNTGALSADNLSTTMPMFVNAASYDYHLKQGSPAIALAVAPGSAGATSLVPGFEYVQPVASTARATAHDLGAFEYGTVIAPSDAGAGTVTDSGAPNGGSDASTGGSGGSGGGGSGGGGSGAGSDGGDQATAPTSNSGGCGCRTTSGNELSGLSLLTLAASILAFARRRRR